MTRVETDLNEGAGGKYIYACVTHGGRADSLNGLSVFSHHHCDPTCSARYASTLDVNQGAGGHYIFLTASRGGSMGVRQIAFSVWRTIPLGPQFICDWGPGWKPALVDKGSEYDAAPEAAHGDLNFGAGGRYIYACVETCFDWDTAPAGALRPDKSTPACPR